MLGYIVASILCVIAAILVIGMIVHIISRKRYYKDLRK